MLRLAPLVVSLALVACGGGDQRHEVWLIDGHETSLGLRGRLEPVPRERARTPPRAVGELLKGPTTAERESGLVTAIPAGVELESMALVDGTMHVRLRGGPGAPGGLGVYGTAQLVHTLTAFPQVARVLLRLDGRSCCLERHDGTPVRRPLTRADFRGWQGEPAAGGYDPSP